MNKKGIQMGWETILTFVVLSVIAVVLFGIWKPTASEAGTFWSTETLKAKDSKCLFDMQRALERGSKPPDIDNDQRPDACDICFSYNNPNVGKNTDDNDLDGMPSYCDKDDNDRTVIACAFTVTKDGRCIEGAAPYGKKVG